MKNQFEREVFKVGLRNLLNPRRHFCIIDFDSLCALAGVAVPRLERESLRLLHCVPYADMTRAMKEALAVKLLEIFNRGPDPLVGLAENLCAAVDRQAMCAPGDFLQLVK